MTEELYENNHLTKEELETLVHETAKAVNLECRKLDRLLKMLKELENEQSDIWNRWICSRRIRTLL